jgi:hypothetical protein
MSPHSEQIGISESAPLAGVIGLVSAARVRLKREAAIACIKPMLQHYLCATMFCPRHRYHQNPLHGGGLSCNRCIADLRPIWIDAG